jgi:hypothetical protein
LPIQNVVWLTLDSVEMSSLRFRYSVVWARADPAVIHSAAAASRVGANVRMDRLSEGLRDAAS